MSKDAPTWAIWVLSLVGGSVIALLLASYGVRALLLLAIALIAAYRLRQRALAIGAQLIGFGGALAVMAFPWISTCANAGEAAAMCKATSGYEITLLFATALLGLGAFLALRQTGPTPAS